MTLVRTPKGRAALIERIKAILLRPRGEWPRIAAEPATVPSLYSDYIFYVAAIPAVCTFLGSLIFGYGFGIRTSLFEALWAAALQYGLALGGVYVFAMIIDMLAPRFGGVRDSVGALKLAAYSATASWVAGVFMLVPALSFLTILGLYSLYLLYTGAPVLMRVAQDRAMGFTGAIIAVGVVMGIVVALLLAALAPRPAVMGPDEIKGKVNLPGGLSLDMDALNEASKRMDAITKNMERYGPGTAPGAGVQSAEPGVAETEGAGSPAADQDAAATRAIAASALKPLLPATLPGGFARGEVSSSDTSAGGMSFASAEGVYVKGDTRISLSLMDLGSMGALAALGSAFGVNAAEETETSYSKVGQVDGRMTTEEFNRETGAGRYGTLVGTRIMVDAQGTGATMEELKAAVHAVDLDALAALTR